MERRYKDKPKKKKCSYYYSQWDYCLKCKHIQNDDEFKVYLTKKQLKRRRAKKRIKCQKRQRKKKPKFERPVYDQYINSPQWKQVRQQYWKKHGKNCKACHSLDSPTVHHVHYGYLGRETDEHIIGLCWSCHQEFHNQYGTNTVMQEETLEFITQKQFELATR